ncbi:MAG: two pore domain potassium channel family protein [Alphaproteobacteria bacterium]|nr:two pore domain potassium channel family protein [Alphaproteobacteria bacterium]
MMVIATVSLHYEVMSFVSDRVMPWAQKHLHGRRVIAIAVAALLCGHIIEVWGFAFVMWLLVQNTAMGTLQGASGHHWLDFLYLSAVNYTSLGDGVLRLDGPVRAIAVTEALTGLMMIGWSSSFTYLKMERIWRREHKE